MKTFDVEITETLQRTVWQSANTQQEAEAIVRQAYRAGEIVLTGEHLVDTTIAAIVDPPEQKRSCGDAR